MAAPGLEHLPGMTLPEGTFTITQEEDDRAVRAVGGESLGDGAAHPLWAYVAAQRGLALSVEELCRLADFDVQDGPMLGAIELEYSAPIAIGAPYRIVGEIIDVERKQGRSGTFDVLTFRERLVGDDGEAVAAVTNTFILPRREAMSL